MSALEFAVAESCCCIATLICLQHQADPFLSSTEVRNLLVRQLGIALRMRCKYALQKAMSEKCVRRTTHILRTGGLPRSPTWQRLRPS